MYKQLAIIAAVGLFLGGCASKQPVPDHKVVDIDPLELERKMLGEQAGADGEPTPPHVVVGEKDGVKIEVHKRKTENSEQYLVKLQTWDVTAINYNHRDKCVTPQWKLMDFKYITDGPSEQFIKAHSMKKMGEMQQRAWIIDGVEVAVPPSGYLYDMRVRDAIADAKPGEECMFLVPEEDIQDERNLIPEEDIVTEPDIEM